MDEYYYPWAVPWARWLNRILMLVGLVSGAALVARYGFEFSAAMMDRLDGLLPPVLLFFAAQHGIKILLSRSKPLFLRSHGLETALVLLSLIGMGFYLLIGGRSRSLPLPSGTIRVAAQVLVALSIAAGLVRLNLRIANLRLKPSTTFAASFVLVILVGAVLLMLPNATQPGHGISFLDALFTATSATCVTGLTLFDTGTHFTLLGQTIILGLIQIGGLGIMTFASALAIFLGMSFSIRDRIMLGEMVNVDQIGLISRTLRNIVLITFGIEAVGALMLSLLWRSEGWGLGRLAYNSIFHSISAFCNAGFSLFGSNLCAYQSRAGILSVFSALIIFGGLGFAVLMDLGGSHILSGEKTGFRKMRLQSRMALLMTGFLIIAGAALLYLLERGNPEWTGRERFFSALFTSITARTAGFNTVDTAALSITSALVLVVLMFIGASPGGTGGGIKTTSFGVLIAGIAAMLTGKNRIVLFRRNIPFVALNKALIVFCFSAVAVLLGTFVLTITERADFMDIIFEQVSAFGTVGLSRGLTPRLSIVGKIVISITMLIGRLGPITLAYAIGVSRERQRIEYPQEHVMIG